MKDKCKRYLLLHFEKVFMKGLIFLTFLIFFLLVFPKANAQISCQDCIAKTKCTCDISDCDAGVFRVYTKSGCSGTPTSELDFSNGQVTWTPNQGGNFYAKTICSNKVQSECSEIAVSKLQTTTTTIRETTTTIETTTTTVLASCPYECCIDEPYYKTKFCSDTAASCQNNICVKPGPIINFSIIAIVVVILIVVLVAVYLFFSFRDRSTAYDELKKKWSRRNS